MSDISRVSLVDTLHVIQLAHETALARGAVEKVNRFSPVVDEIQNLVAQTRNVSKTVDVFSDIMGQEDFRHLLNVAQMESVTPAMNSAQNIAERNHLIQSMAASDMTNLEIARQMQMTTEEVNLVLSIRERVQDKKEILL